MAVSGPSPWATSSITERARSRRILRSSSSSSLRARMNDDMAFITNDEEGHGGFSEV